MRFNIDDKVDHIIHGAGFKVYATKKHPRKRENMHDVIVPEDYDYLITKILKPGESTNLIPCYDSHLDPSS